MHKFLINGFLGGALSFALFGAAHASVISYLDEISNSDIGSGTLGTVTLTQEGADSVNVEVVLSAGTAFVNTGNANSHNAFAFDLSLLQPYTISISSDPDLFSLTTAAENKPYGNFTYAIDCSGCGSGASAPFSGPLDFNVTDDAGINVDDFTKNADGNYFSADVIGPGGNTGNIASTSVIVGRTDPTPVPEPSSLLLLGSALVGIALVHQKKWRLPSAV